MISITFQLDETQDIQSQIHRALVALGFGTANYTAPIHIVTAPAVATFTVETEEVVPAKRGRKPKAESAKKVSKAKSSDGARKPAPIKFRGPNGEAWSGRGKLPKWLKAATDAGQSVDAFRV